MCNAKAHGGGRCDAERYRHGTYVIGDVAAKASGGAFTAEDAMRAVTRIKRVEAKRRGIFPTKDDASTSEVRQVTQQLKGMIMENKDMAQYVKDGHIKRWNEATSGRVPRALLYAWRTVLDWARKGFLKRLGVGFLTVGLLTACGGGGQEPATPTPDTSSTPVVTAPAETETPTETVTPSDEPVNTLDLDSDAVAIPQEVTDLWGEEEAREGVAAAYDTLVEADGLVDLHGVRDGSTPEVAYYEPLRDNMTAEAFDSLIKTVEEQDHANSTALVMRVNANGSADEGTTFVADDGGPVIMPTYHSASAGVVDGEEQNLLTVTLRSTVFIRNNADAPYDISVDRTQTLSLVPSGDGWKIASWYGERNGVEVPRG